MRFTGAVFESPVDGSVPIDLTIDEHGLLMNGPTLGPELRADWGELTEVRCGEPHVMPDGRPAVAIDAVVVGQGVRWLVPGEQLGTGGAGSLARVVEQHARNGHAGSAGAVQGAGSPGPDMAGAAGSTWAPAAHRPVHAAPEAASEPEPPARSPARRPAHARRTDGEPHPDPSGAAVPWWWGLGPAEPPAGGLAQGGAPAGGLVEGRAPAGGLRAGTPQHGRFGPPVSVLVILIGLLVVAGIVVLLVAPPAGGGAGAARDEAARINLVASDLPQTWSVDASRNGPLASFLEPVPPGERSSAQTPLQARVASSFEHCMGIAAPQDRIFGTAGATPVAQASSPAFAAPTGGPVQEAGSTVAMFGSPADVAADVSQVANSKFPECFGAALATSLVGAGRLSGTGARFGEPEVSPVRDAGAGPVVVAGAEVTVPVTAHGVAVPLQFGVVFVGGGRAEATLYTYSSAQPFPPALSRSLTRDLARNVAAQSARA